MNYIIVIYGLFIAWIGLSRLTKTIHESDDRKSDTPYLESKFQNSWKKIIILSAFLTEVLNLLFLIPAALLVNHKSVEILAYILSVILILRALIITINVMRCPSLDYYYKVETSFYSIKGRKFSRLFDWICVCSLGIIIGALL